MKVTTIGIDLAKDVFGLHGVDGSGRVAFKKRLVRSRLLEFMSQLPPCLVGLEACSSAHYWAIANGAVLALSTTRRVMSFAPST